MPAPEAPTKQSRPKRKRLIIILSIIAILLIGILWWGWFRLFHSYAGDAAQPVESAIVKSGATKVCDRGAAGRGPDNFEPWYSANYQFNVGKDETLEILKRVTRESGFGELQGSGTKFPSVTEFEATEVKVSTYPDFEGKKIVLRFSTLSDTNEVPLECNQGQSLKGDANHTAVSLSIKIES